MSRSLRVNRPAFREQPVCFGDEGGMVMTEEQRSVPADKIEHGHVIAVAAVIEVVALCSIEDDADAQKIQQSAELRLDHLIEIIRAIRLHARASCFTDSLRREMTRPTGSGIFYDAGALNEPATWYSVRDSRKRV